MTAGTAETAAATAAMARGEAERDSRDDHAEAMHRTIAGSETDTSDADRSAEAGAVSWPSRGPSQPEAVSPQP